MASGDEIKVDVVTPLRVVGAIELPPCPFCGLVVEAEILAGVGRHVQSGNVVMMHDSDITDVAAHMFTHDAERGIGTA